MPARSIVIDGAGWSVYPSGYVTQYDADEYGLLFVRGTGSGREVRVTRFSPPASRSREQALTEMSEADVRALFAESQPSFTSPEAGYVL
jgi:hypothetical protein